MPKLVTEYWGLTFEWLFLVATGIIAVVLWLPSFGWSIHLWNWVAYRTTFEWHIGSVNESPQHHREEVIYDTLGGIQTSKIEKYSDEIRRFIVDLE